MAVMAGAEKVVQDLVRHYQEDPAGLPEEWSLDTRGLDDRRRLRHVGDFVAGMTDRYAIADHKRLFDDTPELR